MNMGWDKEAQKVGGMERKEREGGSKGAQRDAILCRSGEKTD